MNDKINGHSAMFADHESWNCVARVDAGHPEGLSNATAIGKDDKVECSAGLGEFATISHPHLKGFQAMGRRPSTVAFCLA